jgi:hypothetical protein
MDDRRQLATQTILFGKVIVYECTVCRKKIGMPLQFSTNRSVRHCDWCDNEQQGDARDRRG